MPNSMESDFASEKKSQAFSLKNLKESLLSSLNENDKAKGWSIDFSFDDQFLEKQEGSIIIELKNINTDDSFQIILDWQDREIKMSFDGIALNSEKINLLKNIKENLVKKVLKKKPSIFYQSKEENFASKAVWTDLGPEDYLFNHIFRNIDRRNDNLIKEFFELYAENTRKNSIEEKIAALKEFMENHLDPEDQITLFDRPSSTSNKEEKQRLEYKTKNERLEGKGIDEEMIADFFENKEKRNDDVMKVGVDNKKSNVLLEKDTDSKIEKKRGSASLLIPIHRWEKPNKNEQKMIDFLSRDLFRTKPTIRSSGNEALFYWSRPLEFFEEF